MNKSLELLRKGFKSSSGKTPEFAHFCRVFKAEFIKELKEAGATEYKFSIGHFYISGFFTSNKQLYYFSLSDVRSMPEVIMYRTAKNYNDYTGGPNQFTSIKRSMTARMRI